MRCAAICLLAVLSACGGGRKEGDATQVAARVNDGEISIRQVEHAMQRQAPEPAERADTTARRALDALVERELAAQKARELGLDRDARVVQGLEAAKRDMLAKAYHDTLAEKAPLPSSDEIDRYYESQPALFAQRRIYTLQDVSVEGTPEQLLALKPRVETAPDAARALDVLREGGRRFTVRQLPVAAEDVPLALLEKLATLREGQSVMLGIPGGARVLTVLEARVAPRTREEARNAIRSFLINERKRLSVQEGMKAVREQSRVEYKGRFAQAAASQPAAAASASVAQ